MEILLSVPSAGRYHFKHVAGGGLHASPELVVLVDDLLLLAAEVLSSAAGCREVTSHS